MLIPWRVLALIGPIPVHYQKETPRIAKLSLEDESRESVQKVHWKILGLNENMSHSSTYHTVTVYREYIPFTYLIRTYVLL